MGRYVYVAVIYNFCYSWALFWMLLFYVGTEELLHVSHGSRRGQHVQPSAVPL
jgi:hypothetical protein